MPSHTLGLISVTDVDVYNQRTALHLLIVLSDRRPRAKRRRCAHYRKNGKGKVHATYRVVKGKQHAGVGNHNYPISPRLLTPLRDVNTN